MAVGAASANAWSAGSSSSLGHAPAAPAAADEPRRLLGGDAAKRAVTMPPSSAALYIRH
jgi:hypothetical protein